MANDPWMEKGGPAFPVDAGETQYKGMSTLDYFAIESLKAIANISWRDLDYKPIDGKSIMENMALCAYQMADAMLKAREVQNG